MSRHLDIFSGKTVLLVAKAKELAERGEKVIFAVMAPWQVKPNMKGRRPPRPLLDRYLKSQFDMMEEKHRQNVSVCICERSLGRSDFPLV